jgi:tetratricopeptide (TPR) repeat protein
MIEKADVLYIIGSYQEAIEYYDKALAANPKSDMALLSKGLVLDRLGRHAEAIEHYDRVLEINPTNIYVLNNKGYSLDKIGRHQEAIEYFNKVLAINTTDIWEIANKGDALTGLGRYQEAIEYYDKVLAAHPAAVDIITNKGVALYKMGRYQEAIEYFNTVLNINPDNIDASLNKGASLAELGSYQEAMEYYDRILNINANYGPALVNKGAAIGELGRYQEAIGYFEQVLNQSMTTTTIAETSNNIEGPIILITNIPDRVNSIQNLFLLQPYSDLESGRGGNMLLDNSEVYKDGPELYYVTTFLTSETDIAAEANKGIAHFHEGRYQEAIDIFDTILANDDRHIDSLYYKAQCLEKIGYVEEARQFMNKVHEINPNYKAGFIEVVATSQVLQAIAAPLQQLFSPITESSSISGR